MGRKAVAISIIFLGILAASAMAQSELRFCLHSEPKTFDPLKVEDDASVAIRYLTGGVLVRMNRQTQALEPELAQSWKVSRDGKEITFKLRSGVSFSDGTPFSAEDVAFTVRQLMDPALHAPTGDAFRSGPGDVETKIISPTQISITFPAPVAGLDRQFDQVAILSAHSAKKEMAVLGPFMVADYKPGATVLLKRNPNYWKTDAQGRKLPYLDAIQLDIQPNRDVEMLRFKRGEVDLINSLDSEYFDKLAATSPQLVHDAGPSLDSEQMWFNEVAKAPLPEYKKNWFRSANFRRAVSEAINRDDLSRVVFRGHAQAAVGPVSTANKFWFDSKLKAEPYAPDAALQALQADHFRMENGTLKDKDGNAVVFSIITNSGNKYRERMATMIQDDLQRIGIHVNVVTLDFPSLIERMTQTFDYEAILLGLTNVGLDPNEQMNVWLSSSENHQWNPQEKTPETTWEAEIDRLMRAQASSADPKKRKESFDRVQEIAVEQAPFIYLVNRNALSAVAARVQGSVPVILVPQTFWNADQLSVK
ncbi:MAG TPA: ABC transporter substrate-binding protein [Candidatus Sulfotelmatobacter sp.]|jgi:peptide/nickel transport system substrate-binding protein|nr:ABC transporter substrate-binding protein [Candidatus Sulfotelmatobacter sp.]